jgi:hypothetical protein
VYSYLYIYQDTGISGNTDTVIGAKDHVNIKDNITTEGQYSDRTCVGSGKEVVIGDTERVKKEKLNTIGVDKEKVGVVDQSSQISIHQIEVIIYVYVSVYLYIYIHLNMFIHISKHSIYVHMNIYTYYVQMCRSTVYQPRVRTSLPVWSPLPPILCYPSSATGIINAYFSTSHRC